MSDGSYSPEQGLQTPQAKNAALLELASHFPKKSSNDAGVTLLELGRRIMSRGNSEYHRILMERIKSILDTASITDFFKKDALKSFSAISRNGLGGTPAEDWWLFFLDKDVPGSGGIFDPARAEELERIAIQHRDDRHKQVFGKSVARNGLDFTEETLAPISKELEEWKQGFKTYYGHDYEPPQVVDA
jgi:hypothetical protein